MKCICGCSREVRGWFWAQLLLWCGLLGMQPMAEAAFADGFVGRWDLTIRGADQKPLPSWLELKRDEGTWRAAFVGRWGNARPLPTVAVQGDQIRFVSPKQEEDSTNDLVFEGKLVDENLTGSAEGPNAAAWNWTGKRAPALKRLVNVKWGEPINLFNGTNFSGWTFDNPAKSSSWVVDKGCLVNQSAGSNIATEKTFQDFKLHVEYICPPEENSGVYLRGRYEAQVTGPPSSAPRPAAVRLRPGGPPKNGTCERRALEVP